MKLGYTIKVGRRCYCCVKGHRFNFDTGFVEITCMDESLFLVPMATAKGKKIIYLSKDWLAYRKESVNEQIGQKIV